MDFSTDIPIRDLAEQYDLQIIGDDQLRAQGINEIHKVRPGDIAFVDHPKYYQKSLDSAATIILIDQPVDCPPGKALLVTDRPYDVYNQIVLEHRPRRWSGAHIDPSAEIHTSVIIEPGAVIGPDVIIGENTVIQAGVYIGEHCVIGKHCLIQPGVVIGSDAFYYKRREDKRYDKWRSGGRVVIHDHVDVGANCTINRGVSGDTIIGRGTKIDCLVHIAHGVVIGEDCLIAAQVGIAGKTIIGDRCTFYGQVGVAQSLRLADDTVILAQSGVGKDLESGSYFGSPVSPAREGLKQVAFAKKLPEIWEQIRKIRNTEK